MVEGDQPAAIPLHGYANVAGQLDGVRSDEVERLERHLTEADDEARRENFERLAQVRRAVAYLAHGRRRIAATFVTRVTEHGVGNEYLCARQAGSMQQQREVAPALILREWDAAAVAAQPSRGFSDEKHPCLQVSVGGAEHAPSPFHTLTKATCLHVFNQLQEGFVCFHNHIVLYHGEQVVFSVLRLVKPTERMV